MFFDLVICFSHLLQIVVEEFLEDINNMLNSGEVPNLFEKDELKQVLAAISPKAKEAGISDGNRDEVHDNSLLPITIQSFNMTLIKTMCRSSLCILSWSTILFRGQLPNLFMSLCL